MASCFRIPYRDRYGEHIALKWGETPAEAVALLKAARDIPGLGGATYGPPQLVIPQPFAEAVAPLPL